MHASYASWRPRRALLRRAATALCCAGLLAGFGSVAAAPGEPAAGPELGPLVAGTGAYVDGTFAADGSSGSSHCEGAGRGATLRP